jgi:acetyl esterase/lipase
MASIAMRLIGRYLRMTARPTMATVARAQAAIAAPKRNAPPPRALRRRHDVETTEVGGFPCFTVRPGGRSTGRAALYLPGGSYIHPMAPQQWTFVERLAAAGVQVVVARYGLAPQHTYRGAYPFVTEAYRRLVARVGAEATTILGDSAGGGLALGLAQTLEEAGLPQPRLLMLLAPWVDLTLEDPAIPPVEADDPWLTRIGLIEAGRAWADGDDPRQPRLSPVNGSVDAVAPVHAYVGTRDVLSPDVLRLQRRFAAAGLGPDRFRLTVAQGALHNYPLLPTPEGRVAERAILREIAG